MLPDLVKAGLWAEAQFFLSEHQYLLSAKETPEPSELGAVKAPIYVGENPVLEWQGFAASCLLLFQRLGEGQRVVSTMALHCPV